MLRNEPDPSERVIVQNDEGRIVNLNSTLGVNSFLGLFMQK
jgi:hypothetical protein